MSNSSLVTHRAPASSLNYTGNRGAYGQIRKITIHHTGGVINVDDLGRLWQNPARQGSSHYGVCGTQVGQYVQEEDIAWTDGNWASNVESVAIETCNSEGVPDWPVANDTLNTLIHLVADISKRNGLHPLKKSVNLTWHSMYAATACPGPYLLGKLDHIIEQANEINNKATDTPTDTLYKVQIGAYKIKSRAEDAAAKAKRKGFDADIDLEGVFHKVRVGAFADEENAKAYADKACAAGFEVYVAKSKAVSIASDTPVGGYMVGDRVYFSSAYKNSTDGPEKALYVTKGQLVFDRGTIGEVKKDAQNPYKILSPTDEKTPICWCNDGDICGYW